MKAKLLEKIKRQLKTSNQQRRKQKGVMFYNKKKRIVFYKKRHKKRHKKKSPKTFVSELSVKEGGYLLSRIALQYHRR